MNASADYFWHRMKHIPASEYHYFWPRMKHIPASEYHNRPEISKHGLDLIFRAPALYKWNLDHPSEQTPAMRWGEIVHTAILEPARFAVEYVVAPEDLKRTAKKAWEQFALENDGKHIITHEEKADLEATRTSIYANKIARIMIETAQKEGGIESCLFWEDGQTKCRARPDGISKQMKLVFDLKTCASASKTQFAKDAYNFRYHVQAAFYLDACKELGIEAENFVFITVEKQAPYLTAIYCADDEFISAGRTAYKKDLEVYRECLGSNIWPGYPEEVQILSLPNYAK